MLTLKHRPPIRPQRITRVLLARPRPKIPPRRSNKPAAMTLPDVLHLVTKEVFLFVFIWSSLNYLHYRQERKDNEE